MALLCNEVTAWGVAIAHGQIRVPLQLCDLALLLSVWALWSLRPTVSQVAYFWGLAGSLPAILTPDLRGGFSDYWWVKFFITHGGMVLAVTYLALTGRVQPTHRSLWRIFGLTNLYVAGAGLLNWLFGTYYGYLAH